MKKSVALLVVLLVAQTALAACAPSVDVELTDGAPRTGDTTGRTPVRTIKVLTKSQAEDPVRYEMAQLIVKSWNRHGIPAEISPVGTAQLNSQTSTSKDYDAYIISYDGIPERLDPDNLLSRFTSANATTSGSNLSLYKNPQYDRAYLAQSSAATYEDRKLAVDQAQRLLRRDLPMVPLVYPETGSAYRSDRWTGFDITAATPLFGTWNAVRARPVDDAEQLVVGTTTEPATLNPVLATQSQDLRPLQLIYDTVLTFDPRGNVVPNAARRFTVRGATISLTLDPKARFTDGRPVTGRDLAFTLEYMKRSKAPLFGSSLENVARVSADGQVVTITLKKPSAAFPASTLANLPVLPEHVWSRFEDPGEATEADLIGSGPFTLEAVKNNEGLLFARNTDFRTPPAAKTLRMLVVGSFDSAAGALQSRQIDMINPSETIAGQYEQLEGRRGITVDYDKSHGFRGLHLNMSRPSLGDRDFRRALAALVPYDDLVDVAHQGRGAVGSSVIAPLLTRWHDDSVTTLEYDPDLAMRALRRAGYRYDDEGVLFAPRAKDRAAGSTGKE